MNTNELAKAGDPAFPCVPGAVYQGMSLRDYFAGQAMQAAIIKFIHNTAKDDDGFGIDWDHIATSCYDAAHAMLEERAK